MRRVRIAVSVRVMADGPAFVLDARFVERQIERRRSTGIDNNMAFWGQRTEHAHTFLDGNDGAIDRTRFNACRGGLLGVGEGNEGYARKQERSKSDAVRHDATPIWHGERWV